MWKIGCAALALASIAAGPALAQSPQQTVEGAQRFLSMTLPDLGYETAAYIAGLNEVRRNPDARNAHLVGFPVIIDAATLSHCRSKIISSADHVIMRVRNEGDFPIAQWIPELSRMGRTEGFHWGEDVLSARADGSVVLIMFRGNPHESRLLAGAPDMATRIAYAIEFLRIECDPAASTGF